WLRNYSRCPAGRFRDRGPAPACAALLSADLVVLSSYLGALGEAVAGNRKRQPAGSVSELFRTSFPDPAACGLGDRTYFWICPGAIRTWWSSVPGKPTDHVWHSPLPQRRDFFHAGLW